MFCPTKITRYNYGILYNYKEVFWLRNYSAPTNKTGTSIRDKLLDKNVVY